MKKVILIGCSGCGKTEYAKHFGFKDSLIDFNMDDILDFTKPQNALSMLEYIKKAKSPVIACSVFPFGLEQLAYLKKENKLDKDLIFVYLNTDISIINQRLGFKFKYSMNMPEDKWDYMNDVCLRLKDKMIDCGYSSINEVVFRINKILLGEE